MYAIDLKIVGRYLSGLGALAREACTTDDPRVLIAALDVIACQGETLAELSLPMDGSE
jgi:hypothetical protein